MITDDSRSGWQVGDVIEDLYEVRQVITSGGMGLVHRVYHRDWGTELAVKTPRPELVSSAAQVADFEAEAGTWVGLGLHPHIVSCVYVRQLDGLPRVFAEWVEAGSLSDAIEQRRLYEGTPRDVLARILDVAIQFAWGLDHAHGCGLVHQDVKPANLMLTAEWVAKVSDFGLAKARAAASETTLPGAPGVSVLAAFGGGLTPGYCSPEQAAAFHLAQSGERPAPLSRATDVWSWAISVWEMFTGEPPCRHGQSAAEAFSMSRDDPQVDDAEIPAMPDPIAELLGRCFDPDPATRPRRMGDLADELTGLYPQFVGVPYPRAKAEAAELRADGLNNQALSMLDLGRSDEAAQLWQQALATDPHHLDAFYNYGLYRWRAGQTTDTDLITQLQALLPDHPGPRTEHLLAQVHLERHDAVSARELLAGADQPAPRDRVLAETLRAADSQPVLGTRTLTGRTGYVSSAALSPDGRLAASGGGPTLRVWDLGSGECLHTLTGYHSDVTGYHSDDVKSVALSAVDIAVSGAGNGTLRVWDLGSGACLRRLEGHPGQVWSVAVSADGNVAVSAASSDQTVRVWDTRGRGTSTPFGGDRPRTLTGHTASVLAVAISADGSIAVSGGSDPTIRVWDVRTGACLRTLSGHAHGVQAVALSADGRVVVSGGGDQTVRVWDLRSGACLRTLTGHNGPVRAVAVADDGRVAVSAGYDSMVLVWDVPGGACLRTLTADARVQTVALSPDGRHALAGTSDGSVPVWEVPTARVFRAQWNYTRPRSAQDLLSGAHDVEVAVRRAETLLAAGDGAGAAIQLRAARAHGGYRRDPGLLSRWRRLAAAGSRGRFLDAWSERVLAADTANLNSVAISADGRVAVSGGMFGSQVWDLGDGACVHTLDGASSVSVSAEARVVVVGSENQVQLWDLGSGARLYNFCHTNPLWSVAVSADGRTAISGGYNELRVWDLDSGAHLRDLAGHTGIVESVAISADARTVVSCANDGVRVWDLSKGKRFWDRRRGRCVHTVRSTRAVAVSADGRIAVCGGSDNAVSVWDLVSGTCLQTLTGHTASVRSVSVSADGRVGISGAEDTTVRVWDLVAGSCLRTLTGHTGQVVSVALSADAGVAASVSQGDKSVRVWALDWDYEFSGGANSPR